MATRFTGHDWTILADHVAPYPVEPGYVSTFNAAVREARTLTRRDLGTGRLTHDQTPTLWAGVLVYLALLEQVGNSLRPWGGRSIVRQKGQPKEYAVEKALRQFGPPTITRRHRRLIYALRCAFAHEFGLYNPNKTSPEHCIAFQLDDEPGGPLVKWPRKPWNGRYADADLSTSTCVNLIAVCDLAEDVIRSVRDHSAHVTLRSELTAGELRKRYSFEVR